MAPNQRVAGRLLQIALVIALSAWTVARVGERAPWGTKNWTGTARSKGAVPHVLLGKWYPKSTTVRTYYDTNDRGYFDEPGSVYRRWSLGITHPGVVAALYASRESPHYFRVQVDWAPGSDLNLVHVKDGPLGLHADSSYLLSMAYRASNTRPFRVRIEQAGSPWHGLGYARDLVADSSWQVFTDTVRIERSDSLAGLHFDVGGSPGSLEIRDVVVAIAEGAPPLLPNLPNRYAISYRINNVGCRGKDVPSARLLPRRRVLVLGDSYAIGTGVKEPDTFGRRIERELRSQGDTGMGVLICGVPGFGVRQSRILVAQLEPVWSPELVILTVHPNDDRLTNDDAEVWHKRSDMWDYLPHQGSIEGVYETDSSRLGRLVEELAAFTGDVRRAGARLVVLMLRNTSHGAWDALADAIRAPLASEGIPLIDAAALKGDLAWPALWVHPSLDSHANEVAHRIAAEALVSHLSAAPWWNRGR